MAAVIKNGASDVVISGLTAGLVVKFAIGEQPGIGRDYGATKLQHQTAIKIELKCTRFRFTRWVRHRRLPQSQISC